MSKWASKRHSHKALFDHSFGTSVMNGGQVSRRLTSRNYFAAIKSDAHAMLTMVYKSNAMQLGTDATKEI